MVVMNALKFGIIASLRPTLAPKFGANVSVRPTLAPNFGAIGAVRRTYWRMRVFFPDGPSFGLPRDG